MTVIRIATRQSQLALWQANYVKAQIEERYTDMRVELVGITTEGDKEQQASLATIGGKANFVKALQTALLNHEADIAVHSVKDMSAHSTAHLVLAAICERANPKDAFLSYQSVDIFSLPEKAVVGTASPRRTCLVRSIRPDLNIKLLRGNVDSRLAKLDAGEYDAIILAAAGLERLGFGARIRTYFSDDIFTPAIGQGAIGIECREDDFEIRNKLSYLDHAPTSKCVMAERRVNQIIGGDCYTAIGAYAKIIDHHMELSALLGDEKTGKLVRAQAMGAVDDPLSIGKKVAEALLKKWSNLCSN